MIYLNKTYKGYLAGTITMLRSTEEASLIAQGFATTSAGPVTPGNVSTTATDGRVGIAAAGTSVTITNPAIVPDTQIVASLSNAAADTTATSITRIAKSAGSVTFYLNAAATAAVAIDWAIVSVSGLQSQN